MSGSPLAAIVIPIVVMAGLCTFVALVLHADRHPRPGRSGAPGRDITWGIFRGTPAADASPGRPGRSSRQSAWP